MSLYLLIFTLETSELVLIGLFIFTQFLNNIIGMVQKLFVASEFIFTLFEINLHFLVHGSELLGFRSILRDVEFYDFESKNKYILLTWGLIKFKWFSIYRMRNRGRGFSNFDSLAIGDGADLNAYLFVTASAARPQLVDILEAMLKLVINLNSKMRGIGEFNYIILP